MSGGVPSLPGFDPAAQCGEGLAEHLLDHGCQIVGCGGVGRVDVGVEGDQGGAGSAVGDGEPAAQIADR